MTKTIKARKLHNRDMANPAYKAAYDGMEAEFSLIQALIGARKRAILAHSVSVGSSKKKSGVMHQPAHSMKAGPGTIRVINRGTQAHEVVIVKLTPGASVDDFLDAFRPGVAASPAGKPIGGLVGLDPGREGYVLADFAPGRYGLICFLPDFLTRGPHFARGMLLDVDVR